MDNGLVHVSVLPPLLLSSGTVMLCYVLCPLLYISHSHGHTGPLVFSYFRLAIQQVK